MAKFCTNCGERLGDGAKFCGECGAPVEAAGDVQSPSAGHGQSVSVGHDVGRDVVSAGRDVQITHQHGAELQLATCKVCGGLGTVQGEVQRTCPRCKGKGEVKKPLNWGNNPWNLKECPDCNGTGKVTSVEEVTCVQCDGQGKVRV